MAGILSFFSGLPGHGIGCALAAGRLGLEVVVQVACDVLAIGHVPRHFLCARVQAVVGRAQQTGRDLVRLVHGGFQAPWRWAPRRPLLARARALGAQADQVPRAGVLHVRVRVRRIAIPARDDSGRRRARELWPVDVRAHHSPARAPLDGAWFRVQDLARHLERSPSNGASRALVRPGDRHLCRLASAIVRAERRREAFHEPVDRSLLFSCRVGYSTRGSGKTLVAHPCSP